MTRRALALAAAERRLLDRLEHLARQLDAGEEAAWPDYTETVRALAALPEPVAAAGALLSTADMAARLGISPKTLLRRKRAGLAKPAMVLGERGRAAIRWKAAP
jgi:AraC-like DNA-binding protein